MYASEAVMKRVLVSLVCAVLALQALAPSADARRRVVVRRGPHHRTVVVVRKGWPIERPMRAAIIHPARVEVHVKPATYMPIAYFTGNVVSASAAPTRDVIVWEDGETLTKDDDWTEFTLNCDARGKALWLEVQSGKIQFDWAEVVFENGDTRVVDFAELTEGPGLYSLLDFADGRKVDHVRVVARSKDDESKVILRMQKE